MSRFTRSDRQRDYSSRLSNGTSLYTSQTGTGSTTTGTSESTSYVTGTTSYNSTSYRTGTTSTSQTTATIVDATTPTGEHTLAEFARQYFRESSGEEHLWAFTRNYQESALLEAVAVEPELNDKACVIFWAILHYCGDVTSSQKFTYIELCDEIFGPPLVLNFAILKDEIYCQILKQLTFNPDPKGAERGWQLLWLASGLFRPTSDQLRREVFMFLETRHHPYALECLRRLRKLNKVGERKLPPHLIEVEAILNRTSMIFHKFYFPDTSDILIEIDSLTTVADIIHGIVTRLQLRYEFGFALYIEYENRPVAIPLSEFFFDVLRQQQACWVQRYLAENNSISYGPPYFQYTVYFLKKIWIDTVPGADRIADVICHYHQESSKYVSGYHQVSVEDCVYLGALMFKAEFDDGNSQIGSGASARHSLLSPPLDMKIVRQIVPEYRLLSVSDDFWLDGIFEKITQLASRDADDCKIDFLKFLHKFKTFGSAFVDVRQHIEPRLPTDLILAINKHGVVLIHPETRAVIAKQSFSQIRSWRFTDSHFEMLINHTDDERSRKFAFETTMGYKIDDLLNSYRDVLALHERGVSYRTSTATMLATQQRARRREHGAHPPPPPSVSSSGSNSAVTSTDTFRLRRRDVAPHYYSDDEVDANSYSDETGSEQSTSSPGPQEFQYRSSRQPHRRNNGGRNTADVPPYEDESSITPTRRRPRVIDGYHPAPPRGHGRPSRDVEDIPTTASYSRRERLLRERAPTEDDAYYYFYDGRGRHDEGGSPARRFVSHQDFARPPGSSSDHSSTTDRQRTHAAAAAGVGNGHVARRRDGQPGGGGDFTAAYREYREHRGNAGGGERRSNGSQKKTRSRTSATDSYAQRYHAGARHDEAIRPELPPRRI